MRSTCLLALLLLSVACGGRTQVNGTGGRPPADWTKIVWDEPFDSVAVYLWSGGVDRTWAVMSAGAGEGGAFYRERWDGARFTRTESDRNAAARFDDEQVWATSTRVAFGGGTRSLARWSGSAWRDWSGTPACAALGGTAEDDIWCATRDELWHFDGVRFTPRAFGGVLGVFALARDDVWFWGEGGATHFDGNNWHTTLSGPVRTVSASASNDVWAVKDGDLWHCAGAEAPWTRQNPTGALVSSVWSLSETNTWIVAAGSAMRFDGAAWLSVALPARDEWLLVAGSTEDVWLGGTLKLLHGRAAGM